MRVRTFRFGNDIDPIPTQVWTVDRDTTLVGVSGDNECVISNQPDLIANAFLNPQDNQPVDEFVLWFAQSSQLGQIAFPLLAGSQVFVSCNNGNQNTFVQLFLEDVPALGAQ